MAGCGGVVGVFILTHSCGKCKSHLQLCSPCGPRLYRTNIGARLPLTWSSSPGTQCSSFLHHQRMCPDLFFFLLGLEGFLLVKFIFLFALDPFFSSSSCCFMGVSVSIAVTLLFLPFVVCFRGPALGCGRIDTGEKVVSIAEDDGSCSGTTHGRTGKDAASGMEDPTATVGVGAACSIQLLGVGAAASTVDAAAVDDGTSGVSSF